MTPILSILVFLMMVLIAKQKGFNPWLWVLAAGIAGLILLLFLPSALLGRPQCGPPIGGIE